MIIGNLKKPPGIWVGICMFVAVLSAPLSAYAYKDRTASIEAPGDAAIFDIKANATGTLKVCTKPGRAGDRWRVSIFERLAPDSAPPPVVNSAVGTGNAGVFSGCSSLDDLVEGRQYVVAVTWDQPLPGTFSPSSANARVRFTGATDAIDPPIVGIPLSCGAGVAECPLASIVQRPNRWPEPPAGSPPDGSFIGCGALLAEEINPVGDTDSFKVRAPANTKLSININGVWGSEWRIFGPDGTAINPDGCGGQCEVALLTAGIYTILVDNFARGAGAYNLSVLGISVHSGALRCGPRLVPGGSPLKGVIDLVGDTDSYLLEGVTAGEAYSIKIANQPNLNGMVWKLFDPDGDPVGPTQCGGLCQVTLTKSGGYTLKAFQSFITSTEKGYSYTLSVQKVGK